jgi:vancomycin permeability regulator SanA
MADDPPDIDLEKPRPWWRRRWLWRTAAGTVAAVILLMGGCVAWIQIYAYGYEYSVASVPPAPVAIVFGAGLYADGQPSAFLTGRLALGKTLYDTGKVRAILVSGDNSRPDYDEPDVMRRWLIAHGVPANKVVADYAGFDTYDTCVRAHKLWGVDKAILVSQNFHVPRAIAVCRSVGVVAYSVSDKSVNYHYQWWISVVREQPAAVKAAWDVATGRDPVYLGPKETGITDALNSR